MTAVSRPGVPGKLIADNIREYCRGLTLSVDVLWEIWRYDQKIAHHEPVLWVRCLVLQ